MERCQSWPNGLDSKSSEPLRAPRVRIPPSPPNNKVPLGAFYLPVRSGWGVLRTPKASRQPVVHSPTSVRFTQSDALRKTLTSPLENMFPTFSPSHIPVFVSVNKRNGGLVAPVFCFWEEFKRLVQHKQLSAYKYITN